MRIYIICVFIAIIVLLAAILFINTLRFTSKQITIAAVEKKTIAKEASEQFARAIQFKTITSSPTTLQMEKEVRDEVIDNGVFDAFQEFLDKTFPLVHAKLLKEKVGNSLLY